MRALFILLLLSFSLGTLQAQVVGLPPFQDRCDNGATFTLNTGTPVGGTYSGPGVSGFTFNPALAGVGTHNITYTFVDTAGTPHDTTQPIVVHAAPAVAIANFGTICINDVIVILTQGFPAGGNFYGPGIQANVLFTDSSGVGSHLVKYVYMDPTTQCADSANKQLVVNPSPSVNMVGFSGICEDQDTFELVGGTPSGGIYIINGMDTITHFAPDYYGEGKHSVEYIFTDGVGCTDAETDTIEILDVPEKPFVFPWAEDTLLCSSVGDTYEWYKSDTMLSINARKLPVTNQNGVFSVQVSLQGCTSEMSDFYTYGDPYSINDLEDRTQTFVYPNPTDNQFILSHADIAGKQIRVLNMLGETVYQNVAQSNSLTIEIDLSGVYLVQVDGEVVERVVVR